MITGDIVLLPFPFAELNNIKVRPAVVIGITADKYNDLIVAAISSVVPDILNRNEILLEKNKLNGLKVDSVIKVDRLVTIKRSSVIACLGKLNETELLTLNEIFIKIIEFS
jgi:mRNA interferase MazF